MEKDSGQDLLTVQPTASTVAMKSVVLFYGGAFDPRSIYVLYENPELARRGISIIEHFIGG